jgi:hypothetical protein
MRRTVIPACFAVLFLGTMLSAQAGHAPMRISSSPNFRSGQHTHFPRSSFLGSPFWADYPTSDAPSPIIVVQTPQASPERAPKIEEYKSAPPLLIEWQGDRYVRRTSESQSNAGATQPDYSETNSAPHSIASRAPAYRAMQRDLPPATFVFRDGHREQSSDYSIISGVIYTRADYWTSGSWSKQIPLAQLDLPSTFRANQEQGVPFRLPNAPNEIITRP